MSRIGSVVLAFGAVVLFGACGSSNPGSTFEEDAGTEGPVDTGPIPMIPDASVTDGGGAEDAGFASCAAATVAAEKIPFHLVIVFDKSSSMCCYPGGRCYSQPDPANPGQTLPAQRDCSRADSRWGVSKAALASFFANPVTRGTRASLIGFPKVSYNDPGGTTPDPVVCSASSYGLGKTELYEQLLPSNTAANALVAPPSSGFTTPTKYAIAGARQVTTAVQLSSGFGEKTAMVLFTDGYPQWCETKANNLVDSISNVDAEVASALNLGVKTYVIGVSSGADSLANLNQIARAGDPQAPRTGDAAYLISVNDPAAAATQLATAFDAIRTKAASCSVKMPTPPAGQTLDPKKVNVILTSSGVSENLVYSSTCTDPSGWHYDNATNPTIIDLCPAACTKLQADPASTVQAVLGCATLGDIER